MTILSLENKITAIGATDAKGNSAGPPSIEVVEIMDIRQQIVSATTANTAWSTKQDGDAVAYKLMLSITVLSENFPNRFEKSRLVVSTTASISFSSDVLMHSDATRIHVHQFLNVKHCFQTRKNTKKSTLERLFRKSTDRIFWILNEWLYCIGLLSWTAIQ